MNSKGQVLVIFVILLPILLLFVTFIIDYGLLSIEKRKVTNNANDALEYYIKNIDDKNINYKVEELLKSNLGDVNIKIIEDEDYVEIDITKYYKPIFKIILKDSFTIKVKGIKR